MAAYMEFDTAAFKSIAFFVFLEPVLADNHVEINCDLLVLQTPVDNDQDMICSAMSSHKWILYAEWKLSKGAESILTDLQTCDIDHSCLLVQLSRISIFMCTVALRRVYGLCSNTLLDTFANVALGIFLISACSSEIMI